MESEGILQPDNEMHLFALHFVYLPRIHAAVEEFVVQWNNHSTRKTGGFSPRQLYVNGIIDDHDRNYSAAQNIYDPDQGNPMFGVGDSDELEIESDKIKMCKCHNLNASRFRGLVDPLADYGDHGAGNFLHVVEFVSNLDS